MCRFEQRSGQPACKHNSPYSIAFLLGAAVFTAAVTGCADDGGGGPDANEQNPRLVVLTPPGDDLGLKYNDRVTLRIRYEKGDGTAIEGAPVEFSLVATGEGENTVGSTLSSNVAATDELGVAEIDLVAGAEEGGFRVSADARDATTAFFYINVSEGGFTRLFIRPVHEGFRAAERFTAVEVRLYREQRLSCATFDVDELPMSLSPSRTLPAFGDAVSYLNVSAGDPHSIVAWSEVSEVDPVPVGVGCIDLAGVQLPNSQVDVDLVVRDRDLSLDRVVVESTFDLSPVAAMVTAAGAERPWQALGCTQGPGQLLLDCTVDAVASDGALDCVVNGSNALAAAIAARRGPANVTGCRPAMAAGQPSLDRLLTEAVALGATFPVAVTLTTMLEVRGDMLRSFSLISELRGLSASSAGHRLLAARVTGGGEVYELDLLATSRPVIDQSPIVLIADGDRLEFGEHGFTLDYGRVAAAAFDQLGLEPQGLAGAGDTMATALVQSVRHAATMEVACAGLSALVCSEVGGQPAGCVAAACQQAVTALDASMAEWTRYLDGPGLDFQLVSGAGPARDDDDDLVVDGVGAGEDDEVGTWSARITLSDGDEATLTGTF